ncbi:MAG: DPP IV N-terminal domain-containing protein [Fodinibius sp.]|nr:DPP IV N-terminal domain-containing protein [Fodinibius sp.]
MKKSVLKLFTLSLLISVVSLGCVQQQTVTKETETLNKEKAQQQKSAVTVEDYKRAETFLYQNTYNKVMGNVSDQSWSTDDILIYSTRTPEGTRFIMADPVSGEKGPAFNHQRLADTLNKRIDRKISANSLPLRSLAFANGGNMLEYQVGRTRYQTNLNTYETSKRPQEVKYTEILSPDGKKAAYIKNHNLWVRDTETDEHTQLTTDGKEHYGYATNNAGWVRSDRPVLLWGPNSEKIATFQHDSRGVGEMYLYNSKVGHSDLQQWKYPLPGDSTVFKIERVVVHLGDKNSEPKVTRLNMDPDFHRSTISDHVSSWGGRFLDNEWSADGSQLFFVSSSRNHQVAQLRAADPQTGEVRDILREETDTYFESGYSTESWTVLEESNEVLWFSERDNWGHFYLYDLETGNLKRQITSGNWRVLDLQHVDEENRTIYFTGANREEGNPCIIIISTR